MPDDGRRRTQRTALLWMAGFGFVLPVVAAVTTLAADTPAQRWGVLIPAGVAVLLTVLALVLVRSSWGRPEGGSRVAEKPKSRTSQVVESVLVVGGVILVQAISSSVIGDRGAVVVAIGAYAAAIAACGSLLFLGVIVWHSAKRAQTRRMV